MSSENEVKTYFARALALELACSTIRTEFLPPQRTPSGQKSVHFFFGKHFS